MTTAQLLVSAWQLDPLLVALTIAALAIYTAAFRERLRPRAAWFGGALVVLVVALASPIAVLARGYLFSAHMLQHLLLVLVVPPLVLFSLPAEAAPRTAPPPRVSPRAALPYWTLGVGAMWLWHAPTLCDAASSSLAVSRLQTLSLLGMGAAFWWPIFAPRSKHRLAPFAAMLYLFTACAACTVLGVLVTFSPIEICSVYAHPVDRLGILPLLRGGWGLSPKADQEIGGLMMWVPACIVYALGILGMLRRYYGESDESADASTIPVAVPVVKEDA